MSDHETRNEGQITTMVPQLGSSPNIQATGEWDMRLLSYIVSPEKIPESFKPVLYMLTRRDVVSGGKRFWDALSDNYLTLLNSIDGRGRADQLKAEQAMKGMPVNTDPAPTSPNLFDRIQQNEKYREFEDWQERQEVERM